MSAVAEMTTFLEVVDRGSLSAAARSLATVPSTVSARLAALEARLGVRLLIRSTRSLRLTEEGERYLVDCRRILAEIERAEACIRQGHGALRGNVRVTAPSDLGRGRLRPVLDAFVDDNPRLGVHLHLSDAVVDLVRGGFDLGLRVGSPRGAGTILRRIARGRRVVCATPAYWAKRGRPRAPADLADHECLLWSVDGSNEQSWDFAGERGARSTVVRVGGRRSTNDGALVRQWCLQGLGAARKSLWDVEDDLAAGRLEAVLEAHEHPADLYVVYPSRNPPRRVRALVDHLVRSLGQS
jgi:DNA-binding transcriptional LysR family regulator